MNSRDLAMRDPALAALVGAIGGSNFGSDASFGADFGADMHGDFGADFGADMHGDFGADMHGFGADAPVATVPAPTAQQAMQLWHQHHAAKSDTNKRVKHLFPNAGSTVQIEEFSFPLNPTVNPVFGVASAVNMTNNPDVTIRPQRIVFNTPSLGLYILTEVKTANVGCLVGGAGTQDAGMFGPNSVGVRLSCPTLTPQNRLSILGNWTALVPAGGFVNGVAYPLGATCIGPAKMAG